MIPAHTSSRRAWLTGFLLQLLLLSQEQLTPAQGWILLPPPSSPSATTSRRGQTRTTTTTPHWMSSSGSNVNGDGDDETTVTMGLNELHTTLRDAVEQQDFVQAGRISDIQLQRLHGNLDTLSNEEKRVLRRRMSWKGLGAAPWLTARLDTLNFTFPTTIQINAMEAVNAILNDTSSTNTFADDDDERTTTSLEERIDLNQKDMGIVISGTTGSGKSLAYLVPLLSTLSDSLFLRQRIRVGAEEMVGDTTGDLLDRVAVVTSPVIRSTGRRQQLPKRGAAIATGASLATLGQSGKDVKHPLALIVVPTKELGIQTAMVCYQLVGGSIKDAPDELAGRANMFSYKGPKGIRIACVLDDEEASFGLKLQTDIAITTPQYLKKLLDDGDVDPSKLRVVVYDEADLALEQTQAADLSRLFDDNVEEREYSRLSFLVGASVTEALGSLAVSSRVLPQGSSWIATATRYGAIGTAGSDGDDTNDDQVPHDASQIVGAEPTKLASLQDLNICLYSGLTHERVIVPETAGAGGGGLLALTRLLRKELQEYENKSHQRPRVVVFFPNEPQAQAAIEPLRDALWGEHKLCVLLPETGVQPLTIMDQFKRNETTVMLATANSVRGLDFPALTHVYTLYLPMEDPREYVHLAGRVGRVGQVGAVAGDGAHVVSILKQQDAGKMDELAQTLGFEFQDIQVDDDSVDRIELDPEREEEADPADLDKMRRYLEDTLTLLDAAKDPVVDTGAIDAEAIVVDDDWRDEDNDSYQ